MLFLALGFRWDLMLASEEARLVPVGLAVEARWISPFPVSRYRKRKSGERVYPRPWRWPLRVYFRSDAALITERNMQRASGAPLPWLWETI